MSRSDFLWRLGGAAAIMAACGTSLIHCAVAAAHVGGPPGIWEWVLALLSFVLASVGALLLLNGAGLRDCRQCRGDERHPHSIKLSQWPLCDVGGPSLAPGTSGGPPASPN